MEDFLGFAVPESRLPDTVLPKTLFQTNLGFDARIDIPVDAVILHRHGDPAEAVQKGLGSWAQKGFVPQRMFFADSDAGNHYTKGEYDGKPHPDEIERTRDGNPVLCAGVRPYMLPTPGWTRYLESLAKQAIDGGARAIYPEEPLAHTGTGYEKSFKPLYESEYGEPWRGSDESHDAFFKTARLKEKLYSALEQHLEQYVSKYGSSTGKDVDFLIPIHSLYSNLAAHLVAPLGGSLSIRGHKGYIGQIWSGPVQWTLARSNIHGASFFDGAYVLYDYFINLVLDSPKALYLLSDPVEDDPHRTWPQYEAWYKECVAAELMFPEVARYEVMPWPDRIFLPGYETGGGSPAPGRYRTVLMSVASVLQDVPKGGAGEVRGGTSGIGMLVGDSAMWQTRRGGSLDCFLGLLIPALKRGIPIASVPVERIQDADYMKRFRVLLLSYDGWKPAEESFHRELKNWVEGGGVLVVFDGRDPFDSIDRFWKRKGFPTPQAELLHRFGIESTVLDTYFQANPEGRFERAEGKGHVVVSRLSPASFADGEKARDEYLPFLRWCAKEFLGQDLKEPEFLEARRGRFVIAHAFGKPHRLAGRFIDVFDADLPLRNGVDLKPGESAILVNVTPLMTGDKPRILFATYRLLGKKETSNRTTLFVRGPSGTQGAVRLYTAAKKISEVFARTPNGETVPAAVTQTDDGTVLVRYPCRAEGVGLAVRWSP